MKTNKIQINIHALHAYPAHFPIHTNMKWYSFILSTLLNNTKSTASSSSITYHRKTKDNTISTQYYIRSYFLVSTEFDRSGSDAMPFDKHYSFAFAVNADGNVDGFVFVFAFDEFFFLVSCAYQVIGYENLTLFWSFLCRPNKNKSKVRERERTRDEKLTKSRRQWDDFCGTETNINK